MPAANYDIEIDQRASFTLDLIVKQSDGTTAFNLGSYVPYAQIRNTFGGTKLAEITCAVLSPTDGTIRLTLTAAQTALLTDTLYRWDLILDDGTNVIRLLEGQAKVSQAVTDETVEP